MSCNEPKEKVGKLTKDRKARACAMPCEYLINPSASNRPECQQYATKRKYTKVVKNNGKTEKEEILKSHPFEKRLVDFAYDYPRKLLVNYDLINKNDKVSVVYEGNKRASSVSYKTLLKTDKKYVLGDNNKHIIQDFIDAVKNRGNNNQYIRILKIKLLETPNPALQEKLTNVLKLPITDKMKFIIKHS